MALDPAEHERLLFAIGKARPLHRPEQIVFFISERARHLRKLRYDNLRQVRPAPILYGRTGAPPVVDRPKQRSYRPVGNGMPFEPGKRRKVKRTVFRQHGLASRLEYVINRKVPRNGCGFCTIPESLNRRGQEWTPGQRFTLPDMCIERIFTLRFWINTVVGFFSLGRPQLRQELLLTKQCVRPGAVVTILFDVSHDLVKPIRRISDEHVVGGFLSKRREVCIRCLPDLLQDFNDHFAVVIRE